MEAIYTITHHVLWYLFTRNASVIVNGIAVSVPDPIIIYVLFTSSILVDVLFFPKDSIKYSVTPHVN